MKKLTASEYDNLEKINTGRSSVFYDAILNLKIHESLIIEKQEWKRYRTPSRICRYIEKKKQCKIHLCFACQ
jgi:stalled ribosome rescue protein Dom34